MDCNKDEAIRAKEIADKKLMEKDYAGAKKFALKAQNLYPKLDGLPQLLATLNVYICAEKRVNGQVDWYKVLGADFLDDSDVIGKHYEELVKKIYTDKNESIGADGAFKLISEAWSVLSNKSKRYDYLQKRNSRDPYENLSWAQRKNTFRSSCPSCKMQYEYPRACINHCVGCLFCCRTYTAVEMPPPSFNGNSSYRPQTSNKQQQENSSGSERKTKTNTYWTSCSNCETQYEYPRTHINLCVGCPSCFMSFLAVEIPPPSFNGNSSYTPQTSNKQQQENSSGSERKPWPANVEDIWEAAAGKFKQPAPSSHHPAKFNTYWTICSTCQYRFPYWTTHINRYISCPNCRETFMAIEIPPPPSNVNSPFTPWTTYQQQQNFSQHTNWSAAGVGQPTHEQLKRVREEAPPNAMRDEALRRKTNGAGFANGYSNASSSSVPKGDRPETHR